MKNNISIAVNKPCLEKFDNFNVTKKGGFCESCQKEVIDFTNLSDNDLIEQLHSNTNKICGRFKESQLKSYEINTHTMKNKNYISGFGVLGFSLLALCISNDAYAQDVASLNMNTEVSNSYSNTTFENNTIKEHTITGTVLDEDNLPLPGVNVVLKGTAIGVTTDLDGKFEFPSKLEIGDVLIFSYIGYETKRYKVPNSNLDTIDITITFDAYDVELMGEVVIDGPYKSKRGVFNKLASIFKK
ncbi:carboxypeptidase-like regulatory domain-containing protein [Aurantibacter sp.]|uniref:carboxypeptidase-like regulatory domain-containing protein n=1 Tax=Aurantibacter sp. TaxID=2807103 RepID=UPI0032637BF4